MQKNTSHSARITEQLQEYWQLLKGAKTLPREDEISPEIIGDSWANCFLVAVRENGSFGYNYLGTALVDAYGDNLTGKEVTETLVYPHPASLFNTFREVVARKVPVTDESEFMNSRGMAIRYRCCVLPFTARNQDGVAYLLGGMKWKSY